MRMGIDKEPEHEIRKSERENHFDVLRKMIQEKYRSIAQKEKQKEEIQRYKDETKQREETAARKKQIAIGKRKRQKRYRR